MAAQDELKFKITATDDASAILGIIKEHAKALGLEVRRAGSAVKHVEHEGVWARLKEHVGETGKGFGELSEHVEKVHSNLTDLVPALGALGALGSGVELVRMVGETAEEFGHLAHEAESLGMSTADLYRWNAVAKLTDTNADLLDKSMGRLNKTLGDMKAGKNKEVIALFKQIHLDPKKFHTAADALIPLSVAFKNTHDEGIRARMAFDLFGKSGKELIPLLSNTEKLKEAFADVNKRMPNIDKDAEALKKYNEASKALSLTMDGIRMDLSGSVGAALAPALSGLDEWLQSHKGEIQDKVDEFTKSIVTSSQSGTLHDIGADALWAGNKVKDFVAEIGGARVAIDVLMGAMVLKGGVFLFRETAQAVMLTAEIGKQIIKVAALAVEWRGVGTAAETAAAAEAEASAAGGAAGAGGALGKLGKAGKFAAALAAPVAVGLAVKSGLEAVDPNQSGDAWADRHVPGYAWVDRNLNGLFGVSADQWRKDRGFSPPQAVLDDGGHGGGGAPAQVAVSSHSTLTLVGLPAGMSATLTSSGSGAMGAPPGRVGSAFVDNH